jgi:hypothetical protein
MSVIVKTVSVAFFFAFLTLASNWGVLLQAGHDVALGVQGDSGAGSGGAGGGRSHQRTILCGRFPDTQGKYREFSRFWTLLALVPPNRPY